MNNFNSITTLKQYLDKQIYIFNSPAFIKNDPVSIPHLFTSKYDIEISGFLTALISWGRRVNILTSANKLMQIMDMKPYEFVMNASDNDKKKLIGYVYRTFNSDDVLFVIEALMNIYSNEGGLESVVLQYYKKNNSIKEAITGLRNTLFETPHLTRSEKHIANPMKGSAAKRINMFLRWMVRKDNKGVDFGIWQNINPKDLMIPLDVHTGRIARKLNILKRKQNDWKAVEELTSELKKMNPDDPVQYDYALFMMGIEKIL